MLMPSGGDSSGRAAFCVNPEQGVATVCRVARRPTATVSSPRLVTRCRLFCDSGRGRQRGEAALSADDVQCTLANRRTGVHTPARRT